MADCILHASRPSVHSPSRTLVRLHVAASLCGCSTSTLRRLCNSGAIECARTPSGQHRLVSLQACAEIFGASLPETNEPEETGNQALACCYSRSSTKVMVQTGLLAAQSKRVVEYAKANGDESPVVISEQGSGTNSDRKGLNRILDLALAGKLKKLYVENEDRLSRGNYKIIARLLEKCGVEIILTRTGEKEINAKSEMEEIMLDCLNLVYCLQARTYGARGAINRRYVPSEATKNRIAVLMNNGATRRQICEVMLKEKHRCQNSGKIFTLSAVRAVMGEVSKDEVSLPENVKQFLGKECRLVTGRRISTEDVWAAYERFTTSEGLPRLSRQRLMGMLATRVKGVKLERNAHHRSEIAGLTLRG
jgi:putative resolvase